MPAVVVIAWGVDLLWLAERRKELIGVWFA
jgi:hypothetical protein